MPDERTKAHRVTVEANSRIERSIAPPMKKAVTLPALVDGRRSAIAVYVAATPFGPDVADDELAAIASEIAWRINRRVP